jgi:hypothetical protein
LLQINVDVVEYLRVWMVVGIFPPWEIYYWSRAECLFFKAQDSPGLDATGKSRSLVLSYLVRVYEENIQAILIRKGKNR